MENNKFKKGIEDIKNVTMTDLERVRIFDSILNSPKQNQKSVKSPWSFYSLVFIMKEKNRLVYYILVPLIIILSSGGVVFASQDSLPDSILYPLKVKIVEPVIGAMTFSPENKAKYEANLATERLIEAEKLANLGRLDKSNEEKLNNLLEGHTKSLEKALSLIKNTNSKDQQVSNIVTNFDAGMNAHANILDTISKQDNHKDKQDNNRNNLGDSRSKLSDNTNKPDNKISETARNSASSIVDTSSRRVDKNIGNNSDSIDRKDSNIIQAPDTTDIPAKEGPRFNMKDNNKDNNHNEINNKQNTD